MTVEHPDVERPVVHVNRVVELNVLRGDLRVNRRNARRALLTHLRDEKCRRRRSACASRTRTGSAYSGRNRDQAPSVRQLKAIF